MDMPTLPLVVGLFLAGGLAGFVDSIAGGGGLISLPTLLAVGLRPAQALATNKLQSSFGSFSATLNYAARGLVDVRRMRAAVVCTFAGAALGATLVQVLDPQFLSQVLPFLLIGIALYFLLSPRAGAFDARQRISEPLFAATAGFGLGFYDGFFGPGTGSFFALCFVTLLGFNLVRATAHTKLLNFTSNIASLLFFAFGGKVVLLAGLPMAGGQFLGARLGSSLVMSRGARLVRPLLVVVSLAITVRLIVSDEGHILRQAWRVMFGL